MPNRILRFSVTESGIVMEYYYLGLYADFACLAGECPSTCCAGWQIAIDEQALERFAALPDKELCQDIFGNIVQRDGTYYFANRPDGSCAMLDGDGLCRIQRSTEEQMLCITCRKYPRLAGKVGDSCWMSMAGSCPVVADYLWRRPISWYVVRNGTSCTVDIRDMPIVGERLKSLEEFCGGRTENIRKGGSVSTQEAQERYQLMLHLVDGCLDLFTLSVEPKYLEGSFDYFEKEDRDVSAMRSDITAFEEIWREQLNYFYANYLPYRIYSMALGMPECQEDTVNLLIAGEAALFYVIHFSRHFTLQESGLQQAVEEVNWLYRFCCHGRIRSEKFLGFLKSVFSDGRQLAAIFQPDFRFMDAVFK